MTSKNVFFYILLFWIFNHIHARFKPDKALSSKVFFLVGLQNDSLLFKEYQVAKKLYEEKQYAVSLKAALGLMDKAVRSNDNYYEYKSAYLIADIHRKNKNHEKSISYFRKALKSLSVKLIDQQESFKFNSVDLAQTLLLIGSEYQYTKQNDSAISYYDKLAKLSPLNDDILNLQATSYSNLSGIYQKDTTRSDRFDKAIEYAKKAILIHKKRNAKLMQVSALNNLANVYLMQEKFEKSKRIYEEALELIKNDNSTKSIRKKADLYYNLAWVMRNLEEVEAYDHLEISYNIEDSLRDLKTQEMLKRVEGEYNVNAVRQEEQIKRQQAQRNTWIIGIGSLFVIIVFGFILNQYKLRQKNLRLALSKKETESQMQVLSASLAGQEAERKRISLELHDGVLGRLFGSRMGLGYLELNADHKIQQQYQQFLDELQNIEKEIRGVSHQLSGDIVHSQSNFINAVKQLLIQKSTLGGFKFQLKIDDAVSWRELDGITEMHLFRIIQESLHNILKYAKATHVSVSCNLDKDVLLLEIKDDGVGFNTKKTNKGIGLKNIATRIKKMHGNFKLTSVKGKGTTLYITLPISILQRS